MRFNYKIILNVFFLLTAIYSLPLTVSAHATGSSWEQVQGEYKIDVGYDPTTIVAGESTRFDFNIVKNASGEYVDFADVWVRVFQENNTIFASGIHKPRLGKTGMTFTFPVAGSYSLYVRFEKDGTTIAETTFPVTVQAAALSSAPTSGHNNSTILIALSVLAGLSILANGVLIYKRTR